MWADSPGLGKWPGLASYPWDSLQETTVVLGAEIHSFDQTCQKGQHTWKGEGIQQDSWTRSSSSSCSAAKGTLFKWKSRFLLNSVRLPSGPSCFSALDLASGQRRLLDLRWLVAAAAGVKGGAEAVGGVRADGQRLGVSQARALSSCLCPWCPRSTWQTLCLRRSVASDSATPWTIAHQAPLSMEFSRQEYWSGLPFPPPGGLLDSGIELGSLVSPVLAGGLFATEPTGKPPASSIFSISIC